MIDLFLRPENFDVRLVKRYLGLGRSCYFGFKPIWRVFCLLFMLATVGLVCSEGLIGLG